jgi:FkbM family methyltransferase
MEPASTTPATAPRTRRKILSLVGAIVIVGALARYIYRDITVGIAPHIELRATVPCSKQDRIHRVRETRWGRFCIEETPVDLIKRRLIRGRSWEPHVMQAISDHLRPGAVAVDVGAYIGTHTLLMSRLVGDRGRVLAFEPQLKIYQELLVNLDLNRITNVQAEMVALGAVTERITMSWARSVNEGSTSFGEGGNRVELRTLDAYRLPTVSLIKIDVEGQEEHVLRGARDTILRHRPVLLVEVPGAEVTPPRADAARVLALLRAWGYTSHSLSGYDYLAVPARPSGTPAAP